MATQLVGFCDRGGNYFADGFELRRTIRTLPQSGGEADFAKESFRSKSLSLFFGRLVLCSVVLSMATVSHAFAFYVLDATETAFPLGKHRLAACFL